MNIKESIKILGQAAGELSAFIACHNLSMKHKINATDLDEPDYMDMQTCHELQIIAKEMESLPEWISVEDRFPEDKGCYWCYLPNEKYIKQAVIYYWPNYGFNISSVTHWMPLLEPPNQQGE
jgi:hypothetical protein